MTRRPQKDVTKSRQKWSSRLSEANWWLESARKQAQAGRYGESRSDAQMACRLLDEACTYDTEES